MTCGDPAGIGPELAAAVAARTDLPRFAWIGDPRHLPPGTPWAEVATPADARNLPAGTLAVLPLPFPAPAVPGRPEPANAPGVVAAIERGVALAMAGAAGAVVTAPIAKSVLKSGAAFAHPGHTEFLAHLAGGCEVVMMLAAPGLRVVPATIHIPLAQVPATLTPAVLERAIRITRAALIRDFALPAPRIAVAGLNPHAGESGTMGREEIEVMAPVLHRLRAEGFDLRGPLPADTMFHPEARAGFDAAVCAYHDQALIPLKTLDFHGGVNVTLGLPFVRTSPDHGTAFDIAGRGIARPDSLAAALRLADDLARRRGAAAGRAVDGPSVRGVDAASPRPAAGA
jgi:4-hydroxythreonine-4-phosphate dehydrogenase